MCIRDSRVSPQADEAAAMTAIAARSGDDDRPYLGLRSYEERDAKRFFGREEQVEELVRMVRRRALTVLFGVSGIGKSSLIQAGLFPVLRAESYLPILVRLCLLYTSPSP